MREEEWLPFPDFEHLYEISNLGRVRNHKTGRIRKLQINNTQQVMVNLRTDDGEYKRVLVHLAVLIAFKEPRPSGMQGCHGPKGYIDNSIDNLYWGTPSQNNSHDKVRDGTINRGERNGASKLTNEDVKEIRQLLLTNKPRKEIAAKFETSIGNISYIARNITWLE